MRVHNTTADMHNLAVRVVHLAASDAFHMHYWSRRELFETKREDRASADFFRRFVRKISDARARIIDVVPRAATIRGLITSIRSALAVRRSFAYMSLPD